jgi:hypothetical protein
MITRALTFSIWIWKLSQDHHKINGRPEFIAGMKTYRDVIASETLPTGRQGSNLAFEIATHLLGVRNDQ